MWLTRSARPFAFGSEALPLDYATAPGLGLYVHIPFCRTMCAFCPYCKVAYDGDLARAYVTALLREIDLVGAKALFGRPLERCYGPVLAAARALGLVTKEDGAYRLTARGAYWFHRVEGHYTLAYIDQMWHRLGQEPWPESLVLA
jgi:coproporphyrinogen III oxidase-like Fe-S oxidoreductase